MEKSGKDTSLKGALSAVRMSTPGAGHPARGTGGGHRGPPAERGVGRVFRPAGIGNRRLRDSRYEQEQDGQERRAHDRAHADPASLRA